jgi:hypothetical protein
MGSRTRHSKHTIPETDHSERKRETVVGSARAYIVNDFMNSNSAGSSRNEFVTTMSNSAGSARNEVTTMSSRLFGRTFTLTLAARRSIR